ncbi:unnamed protein product [marine sediment metagenome]|uniref:Uncharacterized protein n=1 Tax=marine sediment metagenome TaxID=412755 RepID=X1D7X3_9ZZZZ
MFKEGVKIFCKIDDIDIPSVSDSYSNLSEIIPTSTFFEDISIHIILSRFAISNDLKMFKFLNKTAKDV